MSLTPEVEQLIHAEEQALADTLRVLETQRAHGGVRLATESGKARFLTAKMVAAVRDEDKQLLASDEAVAHGLATMKRNELQEIDALLQEPYFARIILEEEGRDGKPRHIEYRIGRHSNVDCRIVDWRKAPISKLYYEYREGDEYSELIQGRERNGRVLLRHRVQIEEGELKRLSCRFGDFVRQDGVWQEGQGKRRRSAGQLPDVLSLITPDQFRAITEEADSAVLIQGVAGSGKTTVALHRLAWLLHGENSPLQLNEALILVRSKTLKSFILHSLPALGIEGVEVSTFSDWLYPSLREIAPAAHFLPEQDDDALTYARVKRSAAMLQAVEEYAAEQRSRLVSYLEEKVPWAELPQETNARFRAFASDNRKAPLPFLFELESELSKSAPDACVQVSSALRRMQLYREDVEMVLKRPERILSRDETLLLDMDALRQTLALSIERRTSGLLDEHDAALLARLYQLKNGAVAAGKGRGNWKHIVVDETQDFSPAELGVIVSAAGGPDNVTLAGDAAQQASQHQSFPGWDKLKNCWPGASFKQVALTVSHRSSLAIMRLADHIIGEDRTTGGRQGKPPRWYKCLSESRGVREAIGWLTRVIEARQSELTAVICRSKQEAKHVHSLLRPSFAEAVRLGDDDGFSFDEGIIVTDALEVKGLEFPNVLIWNPSSKSYPNTPQNRNLLHVAVTRAEDRLCLVTWGKDSPFLPSIHSRLVRGIEEEPEEEEQGQESGLG